MAVFISLIALSFLILFLVVVFIDYRESFLKSLITYNQTDKEVILDGKYIVTSFRYGSLNCEFFEYLNLNKGRFISASELEEHVFRNRSYQLNKMPDQMGFSGDLKKMLFTYGKDGITYHPDRLASKNKIKL